MSVQRFTFVICILASLIVVPTGTAQDAGRKFALLVGINQYDHPKLAELRYSENDVAELAQVLEGSGFQVVLLRGRDATKNKIESQLDHILRTADRNDSVLVAFAGHGLQFAANDGYFCPVNARPFDDETLSLVSLRKVYSDLDRSFARMKVLLVDACRSDGSRGMRGVNGDDAPRPPRGVAAYFSCAAGEVAYEHEQFKHGIFFHYVLEALRGQARNSQGKVTFHSLVDYVSDKVAETVPTLIGGGARQSPNVLSNLQGTSPVLVSAANRAVETMKGRFSADPKLADTKSANSKVTFSEKGVLRNKSATHRFNAISGRQYVIDLTSGDFDTLVRLNAPNGKEIASDDDGGGNLNSRIAFTANVGGIFEIVVTDFNGDGRGGYNLTVQELPHESIPPPRRAY